MNQDTTSESVHTFGTRLVAGDGVDLSLATLGPDAPGRRPLLCLHGVGRRWQDYLPLIPSLRLHGQVHALDFRGHGRSGRRPGRYRVIDHARDAQHVVRSLREPSVIYGHSLGALVAAIVAAAEPDRVQAVVLEDPPSADFLNNLGQSPYAAQFTAMRRLAGGNDPVHQVARELAQVRLPTADGRSTIRLGDLRDAVSLRFTARCLQDVDPDVFTPLLEATWLEGLDLEAVFRRIRCPVLLLCADPACGGMLPKVDADRVCSLMADATRVDFPGSGHLLHWLETESIARLVHGFLESL